MTFVCAIAVCIALGRGKQCEADPSPNFQVAPI